VRVVPVARIVDGSMRLPYDHDDIVRFAVDRLRDEYRAAPDPRGLLDQPFTLRQLERLHRAVDPDGTPPKDTFRRAMEPLLAPTGDLTSGTRGKPARLWTRQLI
jgi:hypothetical protein